MNVGYIRKQLIVSLLSFWWLSISYANEITTTLERSETTQDTPVHVSYTLTDPNEDVTPDFSPLEQDFTIVGRSKRKQMILLNGSKKIIEAWNLALLPKKSGILSLPSIRFGSLTSQTQSIKVSAKSVSNRTAQQSLILDATTDTTHPLVQGQVIYTLKLYYNVPIARAALTEPQIAHALLLRLGDDKRYQAQYKGHLYQVLERSYAIFPQQSGQLVIEPPTFKGVVLDQATEFDDPLLNNQGTITELTAQKITLAVKPVPQVALNFPWLPAKNLKLMETWPQLPNEIKIGTPITREITLSAEGLTADQLPELPLPSINQVNIYPDQIQKQDGIHDKQVVGQRQQRITYIPTTAGTITLPSFTIHWWDTTSNELKTATLPSKVLQVQANNHLALATTLTTEQTQTTPESIKPLIPQHTSPKNSLPWILCGVLSGLWLATVGLWWYYHRRKPSSVLPSITSNPSLQTIQRNLKISCHENHPNQAKNYLLQWAALQWPEHPPQNLQAITQLLQDKTLSEQITLLDQTLYAPIKNLWDGSKLWQAFTHLTFHPAPKSREILPKLYPNEIN